MAGLDPDQVVAVDPPIPVRIVGWHASPNGLLLRWEHSATGGINGWSAVVRHEQNDAEIISGLSPDWLNDDPSLRPFTVERRNVAPPPSHDAATCAYCR